MNKQLPCVFCQKIAGMKLHHTVEVVDFEPLNPVTSGHRLVVPVRHVVSYVTDPKLTAEVMRKAALLGQSLADSNVITSNGEFATQTVMHMHVHIVPRRKGDGLRLPWTGQISEVKS
jgi:histidine triad (HIT) family protein